MPVVAMTREMGSLGKDVAAGVGEALGVPVVYHEIIDVLADKMRVRKSHVIRLLDGQANIFQRLTADKTSMSIFTAAEICSLAMKGPGAIFRGWGAVHILRDVPHVACVRVCAPLELRKRRMMERLKTDDEALVAEEIRASDEAQTAIVRRNFHTDWTDASHYDLILNTERLTIPQCVDEVLNLVRSEQFAETPASRQALADLALRSRVRAALRSDPRTRGLQLTVSAEGGRVTLAGIVGEGETRTYAERVAAQIQGATEVVNSLRSGSDLRARHA
jgi:cytidylate kinase